MQGLEKLHLFLLLLKIFFQASMSQETPLSYCGDIQIQPPFLNQNSSNPSLLSNMVLCKSKKLYYRTTVGLFQISSIGYKNKLITISHNSCSKTSDFVSPIHLSSGFPNPKRPNSLVLWNCKIPSSKIFVFPCNADSSQLTGCCEPDKRPTSSCSFVDDVAKLGKGFHPSEMNCTHYTRVYRNLKEKIELGTRISFDVPDHIPNPCGECEKRNGNCGAGLRCICHPKKCKDKVVSVGAVVGPWSGIFSHLVLLVVVEEILIRL